MIPDPEHSPAMDFPEWHREVVLGRLKTLQDNEMLTWKEMREKAGLQEDDWFTLEQVMGDDED